MALLQIDPLPRNATPGEVLRFFAERGAIDGKRIGKIARLGNSATVEVPDGSAAKLVATLDGATFRDRPVRCRFAKPPGADAGHFHTLAKLLDLEADAERERFRELAARGTADDGNAIAGLKLAEEDAGLGGRLILTFRRGGVLPPNRLQPGAPVVLTQAGVRRPFSARGVVSDRDERTISVAFENADLELPEDSTWRLDLSPDETARMRQAAALTRVATAAGDRLAAIRDAFVVRDREPLAEPVASADSPLNPSQLAAVEFALEASEIAAIHGPPGTGKTTAVVELIRRAVARGQTVLATAPSNAAVDHLLDKLLAIGEEPVRLGHPARVSPALRDRSLDLLVQAHPDARQARKLAKEARAKFRQADKWTKAKPLPGEKQALRAEGRDLLAAAREMERSAVDRVLDGSRVICGTLTGVDSETLGRRRFGLVVVDEACQVTEPATWLPILRGDRVVFAGDPCQLPPTILSPAAADAGLAVSLMERAMRDAGPGISRMLSIQYRMHDAIMGFSNAEFYGGELVADPSVAGHRLCDLPGVETTPLTESPFTFVDTAGAGFDEEEEPDTESRRNPREAARAARAVRDLIAAGVSEAAIAVIAPYAGQVRLLRELLAHTGVEIDSVDGFQGREKEAVVLSFVRSNSEGEIGFLADVRRTNVALTRARRKLIAVGDSATLAHHPFYARFLEYAEHVGGYASVWEDAE